MQEDIDIKLQEEHKRQLLYALGKVIKHQRTLQKKGINKLSFEYDIGNGLLSKLEKGLADTKITTVWKLANAFGFKCSDFIKIVEKELPKDFNFYD